MPRNLYVVLNANAHARCWPKRTEIAELVATVHVGSGLAAFWIAAPAKKVSGKLHVGHDTGRVQPSCNVRKRITYTRALVRYLASNYLQSPSMRNAYPSVMLTG